MRKFIWKGTRYHKSKAVDFNSAKNDKSIKDALIDLHNRYFIKPIDKLIKSIVYNKKKEKNGITLLKELEITTSQSTNTKEHCQKINLDTLFKQHSDNLLRYFRFHKIYHQITDYLSYTRI